MKKIKKKMAKKRKLFVVPAILMFAVLFLTQCQEPIGWVAYGRHIEFINDPSIVSVNLEEFVFSTATAELTVNGGPVTNIVHYIGPQGASHPSTLYLSAAGVEAEWNASGFIKVVPGLIEPYGVLGFSRSLNTAFDIYGVANATYTIDGGTEVSPWRVSNPASVDFNPVLDVEIVNVPVGTTSIELNLGGIIKTFTSSDYATGNSHTVQLTGISSLVGNVVDLTVSAYYLAIPLADSTTTGLSIGMGTDNQNVTLASCMYDIDFTVAVDNGELIPPDFGTYSIPGVTNSFSTPFIFSSTSPWQSTFGNVSAADINEIGTAIVHLNGNYHMVDLPVKDLLLAHFASGNYTLMLKLLNRPTLNIGSGTENSVTLEWTTVAGARLYKIYRGTIEIGEASSSDSNFTDNTLSRGIEQEYRIRAVESSGIMGGYSDPVSVLICEVTYQLNGSTSGSVPGIQYMCSGGGVPLTLPAGTGYSKPGYNSINEWNTNADGSGLSLSGNYFPVSNMDFYVEWDKTNLIAPPTPVVLFTTNSVGASVVIITWDAIDDVASYFIMDPNGNISEYSSSVTRLEYPSVSGTFEIWWKHTNGTVSPHTIF